MSSIVKLQQAFLAIIVANFQLYEAAKYNPSLQSKYGDIIKDMHLKLAAFVHVDQDHPIDLISISAIIHSEGIDWHDHDFDIPPIPRTNKAGQLTTYFPDYLKIWITDTLTYDHTSSTSKLVKLFIEKGIQRNIARAIISAERARCKTKGKHYEIEFSTYEPLDDRRFTAQDVRLFAIYVAMQANSVGKKNEVTIDGLQITDYVDRELDKLQGDGTFETWVPMHLWPENLGTECENEAQKNSPIPAQDVKNPYAEVDANVTVKKEKLSIIKLWKSWTKGLKRNVSPYVKKVLKWR